MSERLLEHVAAVTRVVEAHAAEPQRILDESAALMGRLVAADDWLPEEMAAPHPDFYRQYLLYGDPLERFSLVSFVWGPGQRTPVHDHCTWGVIGMLRGAEIDQRYRRAESGLAPDGPARRLGPSDVATLSPAAGDIHQVRNAYDDRVSISIHLYGGNIGRIARHVFDPASGEGKPFVSGYSSHLVPNLWAL
ncbi:Cysteine dioxygenase type I [Pigmentiphaga humi]|uniref:Cysteine dioxygenase type I n=1 Tax=Pigmentiphaga humi TaxID=2478468 RepID=A0A3P4B5R5_9BURK|nr:cysteine dioxygenase [Pigmentiphaga humi]VCU71617.1 Cysteine dioxygenase type I [Pigmentiphaga humi]